MNNIIDNVIAAIIVGTLSTAVGLLLRSLGFSTQDSVLLALSLLVVLSLVGRSIYPRYRKFLTVRLVKRALAENPKDENAINFREQIVRLVTREVHGGEPNESYSIRVYPNQLDCESKIREAFRKAKTVKILTIRGESYFAGSRSLLHDICITKRGDDYSMQVLVLSPGSSHITEQLATSLSHTSADRTRRKMLNMLNYLRHLEDQNRSFQMRCFDETPNFKILMFDDIMFVSVYIKPKNDHNTKMFRITREEPLLFTGLERNFDDLWKHAVSPDKATDGRI
jgi:hypothetical protein